ncbi:Pectin lyase-like superfamily protein [Euphorbia peplus]|nr:Pectin lyase-like superfamily protein [Euphorbia peplus]
MTMEKLTLLVFSFLICFASIESRKLSSKHCHGTKFYNVLDFGAVGDGVRDDSRAFQDAWKATCQSSCLATMYVPNGRQYLLQPVTFSGACKSKDIRVQIEGELIAPDKPDEWMCKDKKCKQWITFEKINGLTIHGYGTLNGQGSNWWNLDCKHNKKQYCGKRATGLIISHSENIRIESLNFKDSPQMHVAFERSNMVYASNLTINAPWDSPNTDGIHLQHATNINIRDSIIKTGDDCISIGDGSSHVNINNIKCGPGHGISIGSLGIKGKEEKVEYVHVNNARFEGTQNGVRIKTWQGGRGYARYITFENIIVKNSYNPIIIDQFYCPHKKCSDHLSSAVKVSDIIYKNIKGTSVEKEAVKLACSESIGCKGISMENIDLVSANDEHDDKFKNKVSRRNTISYCSNVQGHFSGNVFPSVSCLHKH